MEYTGSTWYILVPVHMLRFYLGFFQPCHQHIILSGTRLLIVILHKYGLLLHYYIQSYAAKYFTWYLEGIGEIPYILSLAGNKKTGKATLFYKRKQ